MEPEAVEAIKFFLGLIAIFAVIAIFGYISEMIEDRPKDKYDDFWDDDDDLY